MHAISSYRGNRPTNKQTQTQGRLQLRRSFASAQCNDRIKRLDPLTVVAGFKSRFATYVTLPIVIIRTNNASRVHRVEPGIAIGSVRLYVCTITENIEAIWSSNLIYSHAGPFIYLGRSVAPPYTQVSLRVVVT